MRIPAKEETTSQSLISFYSIVNSETLWNTRIKSYQEPLVVSVLTIFRMTQFFIYILLSPGHGEEEQEGELIKMARRLSQPEKKRAAVDVTLKPSKITLLDATVMTV